MNQIFSRSPVFRAMFQSEMVEKQSGVVSIDDAGVEEVTEMVHYMYTAKIDRNFNKIKELLVLANKYQV